MKEVIGGMATCLHNPMNCYGAYPPLNTVRKASDKTIHSIMQDLIKQAWEMAITIDEDPEIIRFDKY